MSAEALPLMRDPSGWRFHVSRECPLCGGAGTRPTIDGVIVCPECAGLKVQFSVLTVEELKLLLGLAPR